VIQTSGINILVGENPFFYSSASSEMLSRELVLPWLSLLTLFAEDAPHELVLEEEADDEETREEVDAE